MRKLLGRGRVSARALMVSVSHADAPGGTTRRTTAVDWLHDVRRRAEAHGISRSTTARTELIPVSGAPTPATLPVSTPSSKSWHLGPSAAGITGGGGPSAGWRAGWSVSYRAQRLLASTLGSVP